MFYPINLETLKVHDLCRSTAKEPYVLDHGYSDATCDRNFYHVLPPEKEFECMLSAEEREIRVPQLLFSDRDIAEMIEFAKTQLGHFYEYEWGYATGFNDAVKYGNRNAFKTPDHYMLSFIVGYELGIYVGMISKSRGLTTCPKLDSFDKAPTLRDFQTAFLPK